ncbi:MAG: hypothetical protein NC938_06450 [Candidatus Omnitrophica bacterium]|nr:hypothetical protein [Candidatus Omnitrophota bacterium]MCM8791317.1 hypothetical protein [Candidatus Omnitrophota bacterium]
MLFALEEGSMRLRNLRGDLVYATLSPEIADSSGLGEKVIEKIKIAARDGTGDQPGAGGGTGGTTGGTGGATPPVPASPAASQVTIGNFTLTQYKLPHPPNFDIEGFNFSTRSKTRETSPFPVQSDFRRREGWIESRGGLVDLGPVGLENVVEAPASGYKDAASGAPGRIYAVRCGDGTYALVETMFMADSNNLPSTSTFRYKHQRNGTRIFK